MRQCDSDCPECGGEGTEMFGGDASQREAMRKARATIELWYSDAFADSCTKLAALTFVEHFKGKMLDATHAEMLAHTFVSDMLSSDSDNDDGDN